jgi:NADH:ubiquinone oxidoreductase subunit 6 (subunit J)
MTAGLRNILFAALSLGGMAICLGGLYWTLYAPYVGVFQMLIYGGAIVVLFISVIMFVRSEES